VAVDRDTGMLMIETLDYNGVAVLQVDFHITDEFGALPVGRTQWS
jgi:hypothetical protein